MDSLARHIFEIFTLLAFYFISGFWILIENLLISETTEVEFLIEYHLPGLCIYFSTHLKQIKLIYTILSKIKVIF